MKLEAGEVICPECKGKGELTENNPANFKPKSFMYPCGRCFGTGKIDWVKLCMKRSGVAIWGQKTLNINRSKLRNKLGVKKMNLKPGEVICDKCNGTDYVDDPLLVPLGKHERIHPWCPKCHGAKKVDWVSNAIWKKEKCHIKPGVYTQEVDLSECIPSFNQVKRL
jgi:DnaJ-class molecular chaperone